MSVWDSIKKKWNETKKERELEKRQRKAAEAAIKKKARAAYYRGLEKGKVKSAYEQGKQAGSSGGGVGGFVKNVLHNAAEMERQQGYGEPRRKKKGSRREPEWMNDGFF